MLPTADMAASRSASSGMAGVRRGATAAAGAERRRDRKMLPSEWKAEPHEHPRPYAAAGSHSYTCPCRKLELEHIDGVIRPRLTLKHAVDALDLSVRLTLDSGRTGAPQRIDTRASSGQAGACAIDCFVPPLNRVVAAGERVVLTHARG